MQPNKNDGAIGNIDTFANRTVEKSKQQKESNMKLITKITGLTVLGAMATVGQLALGQTASVTESSTSTTTSAGTISEFTPTGDSIVLKSETSTEPMRYSYSKSTTVVDEAGAPVDVSIVKMGIPVQVMYVKEGDRMVARKIIVKKKMATTGGVSERHESTTTTESH
jgi:hypothetical protein